VYTGSRKTPVPETISISWAGRCEVEKSLLYHLGQYINAAMYIVGSLLLLESMVLCPDSTSRGRVS